MAGATGARARAHNEGPHGGHPVARMGRWIWRSEREISLHLGRSGRVGRSGAGESAPGAPLELPLDFPALPHPPSPAQMAMAPACSAMASFSLSSSPRSAHSPSRQVCRPLPSFFKFRIANGRMRSIGAS